VAAGGVTRFLLEALVGAIYLDAGLEACRAQILDWFQQRLDALDPTATSKDAKTLLQEYLQRRQLPLPRYETIALTGPAHEQRFTVGCTVPGLTERVEAVGRSRRLAEQEAARHALCALQAVHDQ
jgi:ribonuclease-3